MAEKLAQSPAERAAGMLLTAGRERVPCAPVRDLIGNTPEAGYAVQEIVTSQRLSEGARLVGRKIGLTSKAVQAQMGVHQPDFGMLFDDMDVPLGEPIAFDRVLQPRIEAEVALILSGDLDDERLTIADIFLSVDCAVAAFEIVGSRIAGWNIQIADTVADNASSGVFVLGSQPRSLREVDLANVSMIMTRNGEPASFGHGRACLGSPISAALWLAKVMARRKRPLRRGDVVLTGALGPMVAAAPGDHFDAVIGGLGSVSAVFSQGGMP